MASYEVADQAPRWTEAYEVTDDAEHGRILRLDGHTALDDSYAGLFARPPETIDGGLFGTPWMEAGPDRPAITRDDQVLHALARLGDAEPRLTTAAGADGSFGWAVVQERACAPAELDDLQQKINGRTAGMISRNRGRPTGVGGVSPMGWRSDRAAPPRRAARETAEGDRTHASCHRQGLGRRRRPRLGLSGQCSLGGTPRKLLVSRSIPNGSGRRRGVPKG